MAAPADALPDELDPWRTVVAAAMTALAVALVALTPTEPLALAWFGALAAYFWVGAWTPLRERVPAYSAWGGALVLAWAAYRYAVDGPSTEMALFAAVGAVVLVEGVYREWRGDAGAAG